MATLALKGCLRYVAVVGTVPRRKSLRVIERAATKSHLGAFPTFIKAAYFLDTLTKLRKATISFLISVYLCVCVSVCPYGRIWLPL